jgi:hypothetical protein
VLDKSFVSVGIWEVNMTELEQQLAAAKERADRAEGMARVGEVFASLVSKAVKEPLLSNQDLIAETLLDWITRAKKAEKIVAECMAAGFWEGAGTDDTFSCIKVVASKGGGWDPRLVCSHLCVTDASSAVRAWIQKTDDPEADMELAETVRRRLRCAQAARREADKNPPEPTS